MTSDAKILLVTGLHPNEKCAPLMAEKVYRRLRTMRAVALYHVPYPQTLLGLLDDPASAITDYTLPPGAYRLDMDLDGIDDVLRSRFPGSTVFEFHNTEDTHRIFGISPGMPVEDFEVGTVGPDFSCPYQVGTWRNVGPDGCPGKFVIELPAVYTSVPPETLVRRLAAVLALQGRGYEFDQRWQPYLEQEADVEASRQKGYLDDCLADKVTGWIIEQTQAG